jgi:8-oxo-dGTP diphosphatase
MIESADRRNGCKSAVSEQQVNGAQRTASSEEAAAQPAVAHVVAGALLDARGRVLVAQRPDGKHMAGEWEFPGGKLEPGEDPFEGLKRELHEELGVEVHAAQQLISYEHAYADRRVLLDLWLVTHFTGAAQPLDRQALRWVALDELDAIGLLEADAPMIPALRRKMTGAKGAQKRSARKS